MGSEISIGIDNIHKVPVEEMIQDWVFTDRHCRYRPYFMVWIAGEKAKIKVSIDKVAQQFKVQKDSVIPVAISSENSSLYPQLLSIKDQIVKCKGEVVIIIATGYEKNYQKS